VAGVLDAPIGRVTIGFMYVVGEAELKAWDAEEAAAALATYSGILTQELAAAGGYLVGAPFCTKPLYTAIKHAFMANVALPSHN
jgi:hypothetical protein